MGKIEQPDQALTALKVMVTLVPAAFLFFAILGLISAHRREK
jgi:Na+/melibiose symporter-like transporter